MRNTFSDEILKNSKKNNKIFVVAADISPAGSMEKFRKKYPDRFINVGVAEQSMIGFCAGLAIEGKKPFAYTIAAFSVYRPFEMIRNDVCLQNLPVTIVGMGSGTIYSTLGSTHLTQEDIGILRSVPNIKILSPADPFELKHCIDYCCNYSKSPTYLRIGKTGEKNFSDKNSDEFKIGKLRQIFKGNKICLMTHGIMIEKANKVRNELIKKKVKVSIYSCHTLKPFDTKSLKKIFRKYNLIVSIEDHSIVGGLSEIIINNAFKEKYKGKILTYSLKDEFINCYGNHNDLLKKHGIDEKKIIKNILNEK